MPLDMGNVRRLHLVADADSDVATEAQAAPVADASVVILRPSLDDGADIGAALQIRAARARPRRPGRLLDEPPASARSYIEALEEMRVEDLPSRPFTIGYVRAYAGLLGPLDPEAAVARFKSDSARRGRRTARSGRRAPRARSASGHDLRRRRARWSARSCCGTSPSAPWPRTSRRPRWPGRHLGPGPGPRQQQSGRPGRAAAGPGPRSTTPEPYKTPGLDDAAANGGSVDAAKAAAKARAEAEAKAGIVDPALQLKLGAPFKAKERGHGRRPSRRLGRYPAGPQGRHPGGARRRRPGLFRPRPGGRRGLSRPAHGRSDRRRLEIRWCSRSMAMAC
ncbi:helix-turn-helix domain-containing protein [Caulobacter segnis]